MLPEDERAFYERFYAPLKESDPAGYARLLLQKLIEVGLEVAPEPQPTPEELSRTPIIHNKRT